MAEPAGPGQRGRSLVKEPRDSIWGSNSRGNTSSHPLNITGIATDEQLYAYALYTSIYDIADCIQSNKVVPDSALGRDRSLSPAPEYDANGQRTNTREQRYRQKLMLEWTVLVEEALKIIPNFRPPQNYRKYQKTMEKVYMPVKEYPQINFVGMLLGPRGKTLQRIEQESGAKLAIRGRGSVKEGRNRDSRSEGMEDDLHCIVSGDSEEQIAHGVQLVRNVVDTAISMPEHFNELKRGQLRELAALNGTLRDDESRMCPICGDRGHTKFTCPQKQNYIASVVCHNCGGAGHFARDCTEPRQTSSARASAEREYDQLMEELRGPSGARDSELPHKTPYGLRNTPPPPPPPGAPTATPPVPDATAPPAASFAAPPGAPPHAAGTPAPPGVGQASDQTPPPPGLPLQAPPGAQLVSAPSRTPAAPPGIASLPPPPGLPEFSGPPASLPPPPAPPAIPSWPIELAPPIAPPTPLTASPPSAPAMATPPAPSDPEPAPLDTPGVSIVGGPVWPLPLQPTEPGVPGPPGLSAPPAPPAGPPGPPPSAP